MTDPVLMDPAELKALKDDMKKAVDVSDCLSRDLMIAKDEREKALVAANRAKGEAERLRKLIPAGDVQDEIKGLRGSVSESHKKIVTLEKELAAAKVESEGRRKEVAQLNQRLGNVQNTFDMMQVGRDKAYTERDKVLVELQDAAAVYHKLREEFDAFKKEVAERDQETKKPGKAAANVEPAKV